ncbi:TylF/MycF/NovP-related O-methyltransferase [Micromonospora sp. NPDC049374]|uniref:TylF/MycF/NovP-related O-methyltransferase n=1 Tax=Micromonospora sp. NPDC049374 TaxID=3154352 RepID=UPI0034473866
MSMAAQLRRLSRHPVATLRSPIRAGFFTRRHPELGHLIGQVRARRLTFLSHECLIDLAEAVLAMERRGLPGAVVEAGAALGGSAIVLGKAKAPSRPMKVYDTFGMIPPPADRDGRDVHERYAAIASGKATGIGGETYYGYRDNLLGEVGDNFRTLGVPAEAHSVEFVQGLYEDTLRVTYPVAFAHVDCDWYESVMTCLRQIEPRLVPGGRLVIDDYDHWSGCRTAVDEYFAGRTGYTFVRRSRLHIVKAG